MWGLQRGVFYLLFGEFESDISRSGGEIAVIVTVAVALALFVVLVSSSRVPSLPRLPAAVH